MKTIAIYNNKGGVGKSTISLFLADYFSSGAVTVRQREPRILVIDLDGQGSSAISLVGLRTVAWARQEKRTIAPLIQKLRSCAKIDLGEYILLRSEGVSRGRKLPLGKLWVIAPERDSIIEIEENCDVRCLVRMAKVLKEALDPHFDIAIVDLPANIDQRNKLPLAGLLMANVIFVPTDPSRVTLNALPDAFENIQYVRQIARDQKVKVPQLGGIILNKTDKRAQQYRLHHKELEELAARQNTVVLKNFLPEAPTLSSASDDSLEFGALRERYDKYYGHVRKVALEVAEKAGFTARIKG